MPSQHKYAPVRLWSTIYEQLPEATGAAASKALRRYYWLLEQVKPEFTEQEWNLICDACNGWMIEDSPELAVQGLALQVEDAINLEHLDKKWGVDASDLVSRLNGLSTVEVIAVLEAVERFWT